MTNCNYVAFRSPKELNIRNSIYKKIHLNLNRMERPAVSLKKRFFVGAMIAGVTTLAGAGASAAVTAVVASTITVSAAGIIPGVLLGGGYVVWKSIHQSKKATFSRVLQAVRKDGANDFLATQAVLNEMEDPIDGAYFLNDIFSRDKALYRELARAMERQDKKNLAGKQWKDMYERLAATAQGLETEKGGLEQDLEIRNKVLTDLAGLKGIVDALDKFGGIEALVNDFGGTVKRLNEDFKEFGGFAAFEKNYKETFEWFKEQYEERNRTAGASEHPAKEDASVTEGPTDGGGNAGIEAIEEAIASENARPGSQKDAPGSGNAAPVASAGEGAALNVTGADVEDTLDKFFGQKEKKTGKGAEQVAQTTPQAGGPKSKDSFIDQFMNCSKGPGAAQPAVPKSGGGKKDGQPEEFLDTSEY